MEKVCLSPPPPPVLTPPIYGYRFVWMSVLAQYLVSVNCVSVLILCFRYCLCGTAVIVFVQIKKKSECMQ